MQASRDGNRIPTLLGISNANGTTLLPVYINPTGHGMTISDGTGGSDLTGDNALKDQNRVACFMAVSNVDGVTPVPVYVDSVTMGLLIKTT